VRQIHLQDGHRGILAFCLRSTQAPPSLDKQKKDIAHSSQGAKKQFALHTISSAKHSIENMRLHYLNPSAISMPYQP
jgi:hypothetical protein